MLALESNPKQALRSYTMASSLNYFEFSALSEDRYVVYAKSSLSSRTHTTGEP